MKELETNNMSTSLSALTSDKETVELIERNNQRYAGQHCIADFWGCKHLGDARQIEESMRKAATAANSTVLNSMLHSFPGDGVTGVVLLAESHISIHTWPELDYAAFDIFMCGHCEPQAALAVLESIFEPKRTEVKTLLRGRVDNKRPLHNSSTR